MSRKTRVIFCSYFPRGKFEVYVRDPTGEEIMIHTYDNSGAFGELALLYNMPRAASIKAITRGTLWAMGRQTFRRILLKSAYKKRKMYEDLINKVPMLKSLEVSNSHRISYVFSTSSGNCIVSSIDVLLSGVRAYESRGCSRAQAFRG